MRITECAVCGLAPCDLPDGVDPELVFERGEDGGWRDQACASGRSWSLNFAPGDAETEDRP